MKTKLLIIGFLIAALILALSFTGRSQTYVYGSTEGNVCVVDSNKTLIADETWLTYTKTGAKITSYSESAFQAISLKFGEMFKSINIRYKSDRHGPYKEYSIYLTQDVANNIKQWAKKNL